mmetsp:Transcript_35899/g.57192  ORF Transcript_35899/g.57192 Transcript_35899/m.57192 type:complete len:892 (+) Transcript_35899:76-2751(+)
MMAPLGGGLFARRCPSNRGDRRRGLDHPQANHANLVFPQAIIPKCEPALCPHPHVFIGKDERGLEVSSEVLERTVTPEAHSYFLRIVKVTQSELEKLLVYKLQHLLAVPVAPSILGETALEELGTSLTARLQIPGAGIAAHTAEIEGRKSCGSLRHRTPQEKAVAEGRELTQYVISMMGRILADFARFADTVLRWQLESGELYSGGLNASDLRQGDAFPLTEPESCSKIPAGLKDLMERLERQDRQNSELEAKYSKVADEQRSDRRAFMRERQLWREQLRQLKAKLRRSADPSLRALLDRDVQFFDGGEGRPSGDEEDIEDLRQRYEDRIADMQDDYEEKIADLESLLEKLRGKLQALQERSPQRKMTDDRSEVSAEFEETMRQLRQEIELTKADNDNLQEELRKLHGQLEEAREEKSHLQDALTKYYADLESKVPQQTNASTQAPEHRSGRLRMQILRNLTIDVAPVNLHDEDAAAKILELEKLLKEGAEREAASLVDLESLRKDLFDKTTQYEQLQKEHAEQKVLLEKAAQYATRPRNATAAQTDPWQPDNVKEQEQSVEALRRRNMELEAICQDRQVTIDKLREQLEALLERIKLLEAPATEDDSPRPPVIKGSRKGSKGGGWVLVRRKDLGSTLPESQDERKFLLPASWASPATRASIGHKRGGMPLDYSPGGLDMLDDQCIGDHDKVSAVDLVGNAAAQRQAIPAVSMPVSGYHLAQSQHQTDGVGDALEHRNAYGGGFNVLDTTAWKGALSQRRDQEVGSEEAFTAVHGSASHAHSAPDLRIRTNESRSWSLIAGNAACSSSLRDVHEHRPKSAVQTSASQALRHHPSYLHGPLERKGRPKSAASANLHSQTASAQKDASDRNGVRRRPSSSLPRVEHGKPHGPK